MLGMGNLQTGGAGQSPAVAIRPFPPTALQTTASAPAQAGPPPPPLQVSGTPGPQAGLQGSTPAADASANQGTPSMAISTGTGTSTEATSVPAGTQARPIAPPATVGPPITGLPGQIQISTVPPPLGGVAAARPGLGLSPSTAVPFSPLRPAFATNVVAAPSIVPPGVLGSAPAGMVPRFPSPPFAPMVRPTFPPRAGTPLVRPPGALIRPGALLPKFPMVPDLSKAAGAYLLLEKPQTLVYVGKIASTVDDDFLRSILELCGPIKSWKRAQEPTTGTPKGFGFCEFELPEGVLRALRLLNGFSLEGQELLITVNHTTREYLERFVQKKKEKELQAKLEASQAAETEVETAPGVEAPEPVKKPAAEVPKTNESTENQESDPKAFGIVNDEDKEKDDEAQKKLASLLDERAKLMPLPPPPPLPSVTDTPCKSNSISDTPAKSRDGDSVADGGKSGREEGNNEEETSKDKGSSELEKLDTGSSEQGRRMDHHRDRNRDRERERDREIDRGRDRGRERERERERQEKEDREDEQSEREREKKRARRERDREMRNRHAERQFENREKDWERDEKEKERRRNVDREKEKEREKLRKRLIKEQEEGSDDESRKKVKRRGEYDEHKRRQREKEDDEYDRRKEEEEIVEAKQRKLKEEYEEQVKKRLAEIAEAEAAAKASAKALNSAEGGSNEPEAVRPLAESDGQSHVQVADDGDMEASKDMDIDERAPASMEVDEKRTSSPPLKKLGFGLIGSGKRAVVPSLFHQEDEEEEPKERGVRELVPIDYTAEEMQAVSSLKMNTSVGNAAPNLAAAAEFAKSLSNLGHIATKEELDTDHGKGRRQSEKTKSKDRERVSRDETDRSRDRDKDKHRQVDGGREKDHSVAKLDTKQLIDTIPKTKEDLFAYRIDWKIYDQHELHERMKPWIQKKILEFLGEEEDTLVEYIVSNTRKHTGAAEMLELLTTILDDEAEMFVMKLWRMLIFEVKKIETGLSSKPRGG